MGVVKMIRKLRLLGKAVVSFQAIGDRTGWKLCLDYFGKGGLRSLYTMCNLPFAAVYLYDRGDSVRLSSVVCVGMLLQYASKLYNTCYKYVNDTCLFFQKSDLKK